MYHETRVNSRNKLISYINSTFLNLLVEEFQKYESKKHHFNFELVKNKWSVVTGTKIKYSNLGFYQHDEKEEIEHIELGICLKVNKKLAGEFLIQFTPARGFYNLEDCVKKAIASLDLNELPEPESVYPEFSIQNIAFEQPVTRETIDDDPRFGDIIGALTSMNISKRKAENLARLVILEHPDIHDINTLVDEILNMMK